MFATHRTFTLSTGVKSASIAVVNHGAGKISVLYHKTIVVEVTPKQITIRDGGWDTISTRHVINQTFSELGLNYRLIRKKAKTLLMEDRDVFGRPSPLFSDFTGTATIKRKALSAVDKERYGHDAAWRVCA